LAWYIATSASPSRSSTLRIDGESTAMPTRRIDGWAAAAPKSRYGVDLVGDEDEAQAGDEQEER
jgi:hypothetical protein